MKRKIIVEIETSGDGRTCGENCYFLNYIPENTFSDEVAYCEYPRYGKAIDLVKDDDTDCYFRCPECLAAEVKEEPK